jgi:hypothetical protein
MGGRSFATGRWAAWAAAARLPALLLGGAVAAQGTPYRIGPWTAGASAGGTGASASYTVQGTLGQGSVWTSGASGVMVTGGIWRGRAVWHMPLVPRVYLPLALRGYPTTHNVADAPDTCPGLAILTDGNFYRDDFDRANDNDWYTFQAQAGMTYSVRTTDLGSRADTVLSLYAADCSSLLAQNDDCVSGNPLSGSCIEGWLASVDGAVCVQVRHYNWTVYGTGTAYTLGVSSR